MAAGLAPNLQAVMSSSVSHSVYEEKISQWNRDGFLDEVSKALGVSNQGSTKGVLDTLASGPSRFGN